MYPAESSYPPYYTKFLALVPEKNITDALSNNLNDVSEFIKSIQPEKADYAYDSGKWTIKQVIQHIIDCERILSYRALHIARKDKQALLFFNENEYAQVADVKDLTLADLLNDFTAVRNSTISLFKHLKDTDLIESGVIGNYQSTPLSIGFFLPGLANHHLNTIKERYLKLT